MNKSKLALSIALLATFLTGYVAGNIRYNITYTINPTGPGSILVTPLDLGTLTEGQNGTMIYNNAITLTVTRSCTFTITMTPTPNQFLVLQVEGFNGGGTHWRMSLSTPNAIDPIAGPNQIIYNLRVIFSVNSGITTVPLSGVIPLDVSLQ